MTIQPFISELIKAANQIDKLTEIEKASLLDRAGRTIQEMRIQAGVAGENQYSGTDKAWSMRELARKHGQLSNEQVALALLDAVQAMKSLQIMLEALTSANQH